MAIQGCIEKVALSQLSAHERLNPLYFDDNGIMFEEKRQELLEYVQIYLEAYYLKFENTKIRDICMVGSMVSYFYHNDSDIDIVIDIRGDNNHYLKEDFQLFHKLLSQSSSYFMPSLSTQKLHGMNIDIKPFRFEYKYEQQYSLLNNQWVMKFDKELINGLSVQVITDTYYLKLAEINKHLKDIYGNKTTSSRFKNEQLNDYLDYLTYDMRNESYLMNIVYRLLRSQGFVQELGEQIALNDIKRINLNGAK